MGWFNVGTAVGGVLGGIPGAVLGGMANNNATNTNNDIQSQMDANNNATFNSSTPGYIDTSKFPQPSQEFSPTSSPWLGFQDQKIGSQVAGAQDQATQAAGATKAQGMSDVATHGGMTSGAAERAITNGNNQGFDAGQSAERTGITASANAGASNADTWSRMAEADSQNQINGQIANSQLAGSMYGANQSANAQLQASKKSGIFGLGIGGIL